MAYLEFDQLEVGALLKLAAASSRRWPTCRKTGGAQPGSNCPPSREVPRQALLLETEEFRGKGRVCLIGGHVDRLVLQARQPVHQAATRRRRRSHRARGGERGAEDGTGAPQVRRRAARCRAPTASAPTARSTSSPRRSSASASDWVTGSSTRCTARRRRAQCAASRRMIRASSTLLSSRR